MSLHSAKLPPSIKLLTEDDIYRFHKDVLSKSFDRGHFHVPMTDLRIFSAKIQDHLHDPEKQQSLYGNENPRAAYISPHSFRN